MQVHGRLNHSQSVVDFTATARKLSGDLFNFKLKGLPSSWSQEQVTHMLNKWAAKNGFTQIRVEPTKATLHYWHANVTFTQPSAEVLSSRLYNHCPTCRARPSEPCKLTLLGVIHADRPVGRKFAPKVC